VQIPDLEMQNLRAALESMQAEPHPYLKVGEKVLICEGPFRGNEGILIRKKDRLRVVLSIELLLQAIAIEIDAADIKKLN
jgi:transcription antitermination factor NusG